MRNLVYLVATSIDGFIAAPSGSFDGFPQDPVTLDALFELYPETCPAHLRGHFGVTAQPRRFDAVVMGARTHQPALDAGLTSAYPHLEQHVATHRDLPADPTVHPFSGDAAEYLQELKARNGRDVWLCGGADLAAQVAGLIDEIQLKVYPVLFGHGRHLMDAGFDPNPQVLVESRQLPGGVLLNTYRPAGSQT
jgi:dihydrofolate reductase